MSDDIVKNSVVFICYVFTPYREFSGKRLSLKTSEIYFVNFIRHIVGAAGYKSGPIDSLADAR